MFSKSSQVLGKSFLSAKDSKNFREILHSSDSIQNIASLWIENANLLSSNNNNNQNQEETKNSNNNNNNNDSTLQKKISKLIMNWIGVDINSNSISFTAEIVQGVVRGTENSGKILVGTWSLRDSAHPVAFSILPEGSSTSKIALPPNDDDVTLSLQSLIRVAQLWQLALAAVFIGDEQKKQDDKKKGESTSDNEEKNDDDNEDEEEDDDDDDDSESDASSNDGDEESTPTSQVEIIFTLAALLFPQVTLHSENGMANEEAKHQLQQSLNQHQLQLQIFPSVLCHAEVTDRIFRGSDLMAAGTFYQGRMVKYLKPGKLAWIIPMGHYIPVAIGPLDDNILLKLPVEPDMVAIRKQVEEKQTLNNSNKMEDNENDDSEENASPETETKATTPNFTPEQIYKLQEFKRQHSTYRASMPSYTEETKSVKVTTFLGDLFWKSNEVGFAKSCVAQNYFVFATQGGKLAQEEKSRLNLLMAQLASLSSSADSSNVGETSKSNDVNSKDNNSDNDDDGDDGKTTNNVKKSKPVPKKAQQQASAKKGGNINDKKNKNPVAVADPVTTAQQQPKQNEKREKSNVVLLRWFLNECSPAPWPPGVILSTPPKIVVPDDHDDDRKRKTDSVDLFSKNSQSAFALLVASIMKSVRLNQQQQQQNQSSENKDQNMGQPSFSASTTSTIATTDQQQNNNNNKTLLAEDILQAATFVALSNITKDQLPLPLSQFGAKLQAYLPTSVSASLLEWNNTKWKKPINLLREYSKPSKNSASSSNNSSSNNKKNSSTNNNSSASNSLGFVIDLQIDWVVELLEQGQGNFVIQSINKSSRVFREHKKSTDIIHQLVKDGENSAGTSTDSNNGVEGGIAQTRGKFTAISPGFLSHRSGLTPELDLVVFGDPKEAQKITAASAKAKEEAKFPTLEEQMAKNSNSNKNNGNDDDDDDNDDDDEEVEQNIDDFISIEEAKRKISQYAKACNFIVTKQDAASTTTASPGAKPGDFKTQGALRGLWGSGSNAPLSAGIEEIMKKLSIQVQKGTLLCFQNGSQEIRKGTPPYLVLSAKQVHNHWVTTLTGQFGYYLDVNQAGEIIKRRLACSSRIEDAPNTKNQSKNSSTLILTGRHVEDLIDLFEQEFGVGKEWIQLVNVAAKKNK